MHIAKVFAFLPISLRDELLDTFNRVISNFRESRWEPSELNGGKLCEVVYTILNGYVSGFYPDKSTKPRDFVSACQLLSNAPKAFPRSVRIQIPRVLIALYDIRSNRGVGHSGSEVNPNQMDAIMVLYSSKWIMAELVRLFNDIGTKEASLIVDMLVERQTPLIWNVNKKKRVLSDSLSMKEKTLLFLYSERKSIAENVMLSWIEHTNTAVYRRDILLPGHKKRLWEYDKETKKITISPLGIVEVERIMYSKKLIVE
ncbi:MAG: hypothetical protein WC489_01595 [Patescibacteria group bacterium]